MSDAPCDKCILKKMPAKCPNVKMIACKSFFKRKNDIPEKKVATLACSLNNDTSVFPPAEVLYAPFSFPLTKY